MVDTNNVSKYADRGPATLPTHLQIRHPAQQAALAHMVANSHSHQVGSASVRAAALRCVP